MGVDIAGRVVATSLRPMDDIASAQASCRAMHAACQESAVGRCVVKARHGVVAEDTEHGMKRLERDRYRAVVKHLAAAGRTEACFLAGLTLVFAADQQAGPAAGAMLRPGHQRRAQGSGVRARCPPLPRRQHDKDDTVDYIRLVEGKDAAAGGGVDGNAAGRTEKWTNSKCVRCRAQAKEEVREETWNVILEPTPTPVVLPK